MRVFYDYPCRAVTEDLTGRLLLIESELITGKVRFPNLRIISN